MRVPGLTSPLFLCAVHVPLHERGRAAAFREIAAGVAEYSTKGVVVVGGDFNARCALNGDAVVNQAGHQLRGLCRDSEPALVIVNSLDRCVGSFTCVRKHGARRSRTTIDYCIVPSHDLHRVDRMSIGPVPGLGSDHRPLILDLDWAPAHTIHRRARREARRRFRVNEMDNATRNRYEALCDSAFVGWGMKASRVVQAARQPVTPRRLLEVQAAALQVSCVETLKRAARETIGTKMVRHNTKPWVDSQIKQALTARKAAATLVSAAQAQGDGAAAAASRDLLAARRARLRTLIRTKRLARQRAEIRNLEHPALASKLFWARWKQHTRALCRDGTAEAVLNSEGHLVTDSLGILRVWRDYVAALGKETPTDGSSQFDDTFARRVKESLRSQPSDPYPEMDRQIEWEEVHDAFRHLQHGKASGPDGVPPELLSEAGLGAEAAFTTLFNFLWEHLVWPAGWTEGILVPLFKGRGSRQNPSNSRLIAIVSVVAKAFEKILDKRLRAWSERVGLLSDLQGGFREKRSTLDQMFVLNEAVAQTREQPNALYLTFIDVRKAYDRVWRVGLWRKLVDKGIPSRSRAMIHRMFERVVRRVIIDGDLSEAAHIEAGVPQGAVLSPLLYAIYVDGLHDELRRKGLGIWMYGRLVPLLLYADDIVLLALDAESMKLMHDAVTAYASRWRFEINSSKSNVMVIGPRAARKAAVQHTWSIGGQTIALTEEYKYLGAEVSTSKRKWATLVERLRNAGSHAVDRLLWLGRGTGGLSPRAYAQLWCSTGRPKTEYACELWEGEIPLTWSKRLESIQYKLGRAALGTRERAAAVAVRMEMGLAPLKLRREALRLLYWQRLCRADPDRLLSIVFRARLAEFRSGGAQHSWFRATERIFRAWGLQEQWQAGATDPGDGWKARVWAVLRDLTAKANQDLTLPKSSLSVYRELGHPGHFVPGYLGDRSNREGTHLKMQFRLGIAPLLSRVCSLLQAPRSLGRCPMCDAFATEDAQHLLLHCPAMSQERRRLDALLRRSLAPLGEAGAHILQQWDDPASRLRVILGGQLMFPPGNRPAQAGENKLHTEQRAMAAWAADKHTKNFLCAIWRERTTRIGHIGTQINRTGRLELTVRSPSLPQDRTRSGRGKAPRKPISDPSLREFWQPWIRTLDPPQSAPNKSSRRKNFYAVRNGFKVGLFHNWRHCQSSINGFKSAKFKGFDSLATASVYLNQNHDNVSVLLNDFY